MPPKMRRWSASPLPSYVIRAITFSGPAVK
jgi:hypothetical protein